MTKKSDAAVITNIDTHNHFEELNGPFKLDDNPNDSSDYGNIYGGTPQINGYILRRATQVFSIKY